MASCRPVEVKPRAGERPGGKAGAQGLARQQPQGPAVGRPRRWSDGHDAERGPAQRGTVPDRRPGARSGSCDTSRRHRFRVRRQGRPVQAVRLQAVAQEPARTGDPARARRTELRASSSRRAWPRAADSAPSRRPVADRPRPVVGLARPARRPRPQGRPEGVRRASIMTPDWRGAVYKRLNDVAKTAPPCPRGPFPLYAPPFQGFGPECGAPEGPGSHSGRRFRIHRGIGLYPVHPRRRPTRETTAWLFTSTRSCRARISPRNRPKR